MRRVISEFIAAIGESAVITDPAKIAEAETATFPTTQRIGLILFPRSTGELQRCLKVANHHRLPVYTVSTGKNWGYGSRVPVTDHNVLVNLCRMNRILEVNENLAYATVEAGVTQKQLCDYLSKHFGRKLWLDVTGSTPNSSVIGNLVDRGHGVTPHCDHASNACNFEVVLADGTVVNTGYGAFEGCVNAPLDPYGLGASFDGLFVQSNLGIVTKATIWLYPAPETVQLALISAETPDQLVKIIDLLRPLRLQGVLRSGPNFGNDSFLMSRRLPRPDQFDRLRGDQLASQLSLMARSHSLPLWRGIVPLYGTANEVALLRARIESLLPVAIQYIAEDQLVSGATPEDSRQDLLNTIWHFTGRPTGYGLPRAYWRSKRRPPNKLDELDLDYDRCGISIVSISCPFDGQHIVNLSKLARNQMLHHGLEPHLSFSGVRARTLQLNAFVCFNRENREEEEAAQTCRRELISLAMAEGYYPNRLDVASMKMVMSAAAGAYSTLTQRIKHALDPKLILAPGRYSCDPATDSATRVGD
jgi:4-cresol dehydrogenase (hydroxylating)